ncbi:MAG TPA: rhodanese-like domain-containing protein [Edaphobacter sp.]|nr:rhodanese-like domain-containing protein [Edaphobacter sp.]
MKNLCALLIFLFSSALLAQTAPEPLLIDTAYLQKHLQDADSVLIEVGSHEEYEKQHIAGARLLTVEDVSTPAKAPAGQLGMELLPAETLRHRLEAAGISDGSHVLVYSGEKESFPRTARVVFALQYMGLGDRTSVLNGGLAAWMKEGKPVTTEPPQIVAGRLTVGPVAVLVADASLVRSIQDRSDFKLVDARAPNFYNGTDASFNGKGHIPGAVNIPFSQVATQDSEIDLGHLRQAFADAGVKPGDTVVTYCHLGVQASATLFAARLLGHPVKLYDGSFQDWMTNHRGDVVK